MLKEDLCAAYQQVMEDNSFTYGDLSKLTGLHKAQLANILKHNGKSVSVDKMEEGLNRLGFGVSAEFFNLEEE